MEASASPATFAPWQQRAYERARAALDSGRLGHALLLCGPERLGKRAVAEALARYALCTGKERGTDACGRCRSCRLFDARAQRDPVEVRPDGTLAHPDGHSSHPDLLLVGYEWKLRPSPARPRTEIVIDQMRELSTRLGLSSGSESGTRVAIVEPADAVNYHAWNAILKTLEEPQPGRYLWLVVSNPARLPATIRSRCQRLDFHLPPRDEAQAWLQARGHARKAADEALDAARGHPGLADAWLSDGGIALRREVATDLAKLGRGELGAVEVAQRWTSGDDTAMRLRHAADIALAEAEAEAATSLTGQPRIRKLAIWFDAANRTRELLQTTVRADLAVAELLLAWRGEDGGAITQARGRA